MGRADRARRRRLAHRESGSFRANRDYRPRWARRAEDFERCPKGAADEDVKWDKERDDGKLR